MSVLYLRREHFIKFSIAALLCIYIYIYIHIHISKGNSIILTFDSINFQQIVAIPDTMTKVVD